MAGDSVDQVRDRTDIVEIISQHVDLRKAGRSFKGLCPFHQEKTPSFIVFPESQTFHCFGCGAGGDVFNFVMQHDHVDFRGALEELAQRAGVELAPAASPPPPEQVEHEHRLYELTRRAAAWFSHVLWRTSYGEAGRELLERRGVDQATAERFGLGYAPDGWDNLLKFMTGRGVQEDDLAATGLITRRDDGGAYDRFRSRLIFPIRDREGRVIGFGGRAMGDAQPKYLNSPQTVLFDKSSHLYALDLAQESIRQSHEVVVVEGYMDAIAAHQFGFTNVVASMGTALTAEQARLLKRGVDRIILALDADAAGQMATVRGLDVLRQSLSEADRPALDAVGMVRFEKSLKADIRIVRLPHGKDPDELIRNDPQAWREALANPAPLVDFYISAIVGDDPPDDPRAKSDIVQRISPILREISDRVVQAHYVAEVARRLQINERLVLSAPQRRNQRALAAQPKAPRLVITPEEYLIGLILRHPLILASMLSEIQEQDILDGRRLELLRAIRGETAEAIPEVIEDLPDELRAYAGELIASIGEKPGGFPGQVRREAEQALRRLRKDRHDLRMRQLMADIAEAERDGDRDALLHGMSLLDQIKQRYPEFYPGPSPYFKDARDTATGSR